MTFRLKPIEVQAIQIPEGIFVEVRTEAGQPGNVAEGGEWLVVMDDRIVAFEPERFEKQFEKAPGPGVEITVGAPRGIPGVDLPNLERAIRKAKALDGLCAPVPPASPAEVTVGEGPLLERKQRGWLTNLILEGLREKARTAGELVAYAQSHGRNPSRGSVQSTLRTLRVDGKVTGSEVGEWRLA